MKIPQSNETVTFLRYIYKNSDEVSFFVRILKISKAKLFSFSSAVALSHFSCKVDIP